MICVNCNSEITVARVCPHCRLNPLKYGEDPVAVEATKRQQDEEVAEWNRQRRMQGICTAEFCLNGKEYKWAGWFWNRVEIYRNCPA